MCTEVTSTKHQTYYYSVKVCNTGMDLRWITSFLTFTFYTSLLKSGFLSSVSLMYNLSRLNYGQLCMEMPPVNARYVMYVLNNRPS